MIGKKEAASSGIAPEGFAGQVLTRSLAGPVDMKTDRLKPVLLVL
jgi:hypothetical protein